MKRSIIFSLLVIFLLFASTKTVFAFPSTRFLLPSFGGRVVFSPAIEIASYQMAGFTCAVLGSTFSIYPIGPANTPTSYFVPSGVFSKTGNSIHTGQFIIGKYSFMKTPIVCTSATVPPVIVTVPLDTVTLFGNSR